MDKISLQRSTCSSLPTLSQPLRKPADKGLFKVSKNIIISIFLISTAYALADCSISLAELYSGYKSNLIYPSYLSANSEVFANENASQRNNFACLILVGWKCRWLSKTKTFLCTQKRTNTPTCTEHTQAYKNTLV